jgi:hypothetical protein
MKFLLESKQAQPVKSELSQYKKSGKSLKEKVAERNQIIE